MHDRRLLSEFAEAAVGMCIKGEDIMDKVPSHTCLLLVSYLSHTWPILVLYLQVLSATGFRYLVEGQDAKMKPGLVGNKPGDEVSCSLTYFYLLTYLLLLAH